MHDNYNDLNQYVNNENASISECHSDVVYNVNIDAKNITEDYSNDINTTS